MKKAFVIISFFVLVIAALSFSKESLRSIYSKPSSQWPKPTVDAGVQWTELGILPPSPIEQQKDSLKYIIELGKALFFDERLSGSGKISCATCHQPELNWTDGKEKSIGHEGTINKRNSPTIQNSWFYKSLFWDGRSRDLQDQAFAPLNSETEMHSEMPDIMRKLRKINGYRELFKKAFGSDEIDPFVMTEAIATFEKTIISNKSRFDEFLEGNTKALSNKEIRGLHLFRTKARCMNCHNGNMFSDNQFHNNGFSDGDEGYYKVSHNDEDKGKLKTPSLRDVAFTGPWMHNGQMRTLEQVIQRYSHSKFPGSPLLQPLNLNEKDKRDLLAFLKAISAKAPEFEKPVLP